MVQRKEPEAPSVSARRMRTVPDVRSGTQLRRIFDHARLLIDLRLIRSAGCPKTRREDHAWCGVIYPDRISQKESA
jgi:hypothetical protein